MINIFFKKYNVGINFFKKMWIRLVPFPGYPDTKVSHFSVWAFLRDPNFLLIPVHSLLSVPYIKVIQPIQEFKYVINS